MYVEGGVGWKLSFFMELKKGRRRRRRNID
jgi:hypothetical protein